MDRKRTVFISYRRDDSGYAAGRLFDRLSQHFGSDRIFMDIDTIELGIDFASEVPLGRVRFDDGQRAFDCHVSCLSRRCGGQRPMRPA